MAWLAEYAAVWKIWRKIRDLADKCLKNDEASEGLNRLSVEENRLLFRSRNSVTLALLVSKGLLSVVCENSPQQLKIELVHDSIAVASKLNAIAIATLDHVPLGASS